MGYRNLEQHYNRVLGADECLGESKTKFPSGTTVDRPSLYHLSVSIAQCSLRLVAYRVFGMGLGILEWGMEAVGL